MQKATARKKESRMRNLCIAAIMMAAFLLWPMSSQAGAPQEKPTPDTPSPAARFTVFPLLNLYQKHLSAFTIARCPSWPSCSRYSRQSVTKHGPVVGVFMTVDRLIHEGGYIKTGRKIFIPGRGFAIYDPPEQNDFWWFEKKKAPLPDIPQLSAR